MSLTGETLIGSRTVAGTGVAVRGLNPATNEPLEPTFPDSSLEQVNEACELAAKAFDVFRGAPLEKRAALLEFMAEEILAMGDLLIERVMAESGLPRQRLEGERGRTVGQLRLFASVVRDGRFLSATLDSAMPDRKPLPRQDLRMRKIPLGPVAVFGSSNFPLAFSVAGGDTAAALAAGCPIVVKSHPSHPGTSELVGKAIQRAVAKSGLPDGVFSLIHGSAMDVGQMLVKHPAICAVGFTGSRRGGLALVEVAAKRPVPIPVYAEMSSVNPVFLLPSALAARAETIAQGYVDSATLGAGQFCTQPGLVFGIESPEMQSFMTAAGEKLAAKASTPMLNSGIRGAYAKGAETLAKDGALRKIAEGQDAEGVGLTGRPALFVTEAAEFVKNPHLAEELFGPSSIIVLCRNVDEMVAIAEGLEGQLTATLQMDSGDFAAAKRLLPVLERKAGRILANGFPTGVEVGYAMVHGGPFPSTSDGRSTSVGATAIDRFLRPVCYQDIPDELLAPELQDGNPLGVWRLKDGKLIVG
ncbi:aldehyde dehydrogenase (NADP(+)) [Granulicella sp. dw_53]|uniref:aldehyde dehydrogenase (NADP(+)) n=1 Tax=Granulicella sp. dw_53 TaxID=2719792 RepID=UPI001BD2017B|nr:aldehyde dehydrogenase (NADP(+)) [Granulicella sp. dw_53]